MLAAPKDERHSWKVQILGIQGQIRDASKTLKHVQASMRQASPVQSPAGGPTPASRVSTEMSAPAGDLVRNVAPKKTHNVESDPIDKKKTIAEVSVAVQAIFAFHSHNQKLTCTSILWQVHTH